MVRRSGAPLLLIGGVAAAVVGLVLLILYVDVSSSWVVVIAGGMTVSLVASRWIEARLLGTEQFSVLRLVGFYFFATTTLGIIYFWDHPVARSRSGYTDSDLLSAGLVLLVGWIMVSYGYLLLPRSATSKLRQAIPSNRSFVIPRLYVALAVGWCARAELVASNRYLHVATDDSALQSSQTTFIINTIAQFPAFVFLVFLWSASRGNSHTRMWAVVLFLSEVGWALASGARTAFVGVLLGALIVMYYSRQKRTPVVPLIAAVLIAIVAFPIILAVRSAPEDNEGSVSTSQSSTIGALLSSPNAVIARFSDSDAAASALRHEKDVDDVVPASRLMQMSASAFVPRLLWADKPDPLLVGNEFGRKTAMIQSNDMRTSISLPLPLMWFLVGGYPMLLVGGAITGLLLRFMNDLLLARETDPGVAAIFGLLAISIVTIPATILPAGFAAVMKVSATFIVLLFVVTRKGTEESPSRLL